MRRSTLLLALTLAACRGEAPPDSEPEPAGQRQVLPPGASATPSQPPPAPTPAEVEATGNWLEIADQGDRERIALLDSAWRDALKEARVRNADEVAALVALAEPGAGLERPHPAPGLYRCRTIKLGSQAVGATLAYVAYPYFRCRIDLTSGGDLTLAKLTGSQRVTGEFHPERNAAGEDTERLIFLGAVAWGADEASAPAYGAQEERDQVGVLERIGPDRYRLALPWPRQESKLDLLKLERIGN